MRERTKGGKDMHSISRLTIAGILAGTAICSVAHAQEEARRDYAIPAQELKYSLRAVTRPAGYELIATSQNLRGKRAPALKGRYSVAEAIEALLKDTGLAAEVSGRTVFIRGRSEPPRAEIANSSEVDTAIVVTGSRIRGASVASPTILRTQEDMNNAGEYRLADVIRNIPQNFGGGQNPGIGLNVPAGSGVNIGSASTLNLRGLGSDATLTLLNGHRLAYNITRQAVDISAIPVAAVERIEIVADGASAIYGSDAVAGVANIILKRDFDGLVTSARFGASTDGGNVQQQYGIVGGREWGSGGLMVAYDFERDTGILSEQRSYAAGPAPGLTLYPPLKRHNVILTGHQMIAHGLRFDIDALYNSRRSDYFYALTSAGDYRTSGAYNIGKSQSYAIAPSLTLSLGHDWEVSVSALHGVDRTHYGTDFYSSGTKNVLTRGCYCNKAQSVEVSGNGALFNLPGGAARLALGAGYRSNDFHGFRTVGTAQDIRVSQDSYFAYGELSLPVISPDSSSSGSHRLELNGALRYEKYPGVDTVVTPKLGLIYAPTPDFELKGSWGRSFRAPTLYQRYNISSAQVLAAASRGGTGYPANATVIQLAGGNPDLKPERARTWSATLVAHPRALEGLRLELSYFDISYRDRIVAPITFVAQALSNPIYGDLVLLSPSDAQKAAAVANADVFLGTTTGRPYDPSEVVAIIDNVNRNAAVQSVNGVDVQASYLADLGAYGSLRFAASGSYLRSRQRLSALQPEIRLAGSIFNPPHFRARGGVAWNTGALTLTSFLNYIGSVEDVRSEPVTGVGSMTTLDLTARYTIEQGPSLFRNVELSLSLQNLLNDKPDLIRSTRVYEAPYDSTNYSPVGRFVSIGISKKW